MTDSTQELVKRLDDIYRWCLETGDGGRTNPEILLDAKAEIERLAKVIEVARETLQDVSRCGAIGLNLGAKVRIALALLTPAGETEARDG